MTTIRVVDTAASTPRLGISTPMIVVRTAAMRTRPSVVASRNEFLAIRG